jgi:hypothetical protein
MSVMLTNVANAGAGSMCGMLEPGRSPVMFRRVVRRFGGVFLGLAHRCRGRVFLGFADRCRGRC